MKKTLLSVLALILFAAPAHAERIICASTTSTQNSGLFDFILPLFSARTGVDVHMIAVGTGAALEMARRGDADVVFVHAKDLELEGVREGYFVDRHDVMYNDFVIVGPESAGDEFRGMEKASDVLVSIAETKALFVSRGDNSGTHRKELALWSEAGITPEANGWYLEVGQGMAKTLRIADEKQAFTLTDRGTWLAIKDRDRFAIRIVFEGDPALFNQYGAMAVNPDRHPHVKAREAMSFVNWLVSEEGQEAIGRFTDARGNRLFIPNAGE
jgi:tungstate transport system substrate-binding protein